jgi:catechol 2,3-dioxygenase-like lactoylglutathione lyase family enzyme
MKRPAFLLTVLLCCAVAANSDAPKRPRILGIAGVTILVSDVPASRSFYQKVIDPEHACNFCEDVPSRSFFLQSGQHITLDQLSAPASSSLLAQVSFRTGDLQKLRKFMKANGVGFEERKTKGKGGQSGTLTGLLVRDPDGHQISFVGPPELFSEPSTSLGPPPTIQQSFPSIRIIHAGFIVRDRAAIEHFYKDILGFRPYWHGGMKDDQTDWVSMQVPDGTDWLEFMVNVEPDADQRLRGIMNHIAIGVPDIHAAQKKLLENGLRLTEEPKIGRDGKWQLNLYDPDQTRVEFMEFTPVQKPCCSEFTGPHPGPQSPSKAPAKP